MIKIPCQLAKDGANHAKKLVGNKQLEIKLDGVRVLSVVDPSGEVIQFSRTGKELKNFPLLREQLSKIAFEFSEPMVLDGEVTSESFQALMTQLNRKYDVDASDAILYLFDIIPLSELESGTCSTPQIHRTARVQMLSVVNRSLLPNVRAVNTTLVDLNTDEGYKEFLDFNKKAVEDGYEGIMVKDTGARYEGRRTAAWLKLKPFVEVSLDVVDVVEGLGKHCGRAGALVCSGIDDGKQIEVSVGTGLSDSLRLDIWNNRDSVVGRVVEIRADAVTQNQDGGYSLRFPRFTRFRGFEPGEKL